ncbi:FkbM family methyltransferase [bacterium]|nr:MAG: FkbM family methyltransferase [bacterium]
MTFNLLAKFEQAQSKEKELHSIFRGSVLGKLRYYPWRALVTKVLFKFMPNLQSSWVVKNTLFTGQDFYTEGYFMDYYLCGIIGEENETNLTKWMLKNIKDQEVFFDIGAHYGFYSLVVEASTQGASKIYSFEPTPSTRKILLKNTKPFANIQVVPKAVVERSGERNLNVYTAGGKRGSNSFYAEEALSITQSETKLESVPVETTTIDEFSSENSLRPTFIKLDIENAELDALRGGMNILRTVRPKLAMEVWPGPNNSRHKEAAFLLLQLGYKLYELDSSGDENQIEDLEVWFEGVSKTENLIGHF